MLSLNGLHFWMGPIFIYKLFKYIICFANRCIYRILRPIKFPKWPKKTEEFACIGMENGPFIGHII